MILYHKLTFFLYLLQLLFISVLTLLSTAQQINLKFVTQYIDEVTLKHNLYSSSKKFKNVNINQNMQQIKVFIQYDNNGLIVKNQLSKMQVDSLQINSNILIIYSNNPLKSIDQNNQSTSRLLQTKQSQINLNLTSNNASIQIQISQKLSQQLFDNPQIVGDTILQFDLNDESFYASYLRQSSMQIIYFMIIGYVIIGFLVINYFIRCFITDLNIKSDHGQMIAHYLTLASPTLIINTFTSELMSFCYGFMGINFPWMNQRLGYIFGRSIDNSLFQTRIFYVNMNMGSTYALTLGVIIILIVFGYAIISCCSSDKLSSQKYYSIYSNYLYNIFIYGMLFSSLLSIQGCTINPIVYIFSFDDVANSAFYILGIIMFVLIIIQSIHSLCVYQSQHFYKVRILIKTILLSMSHFNYTYFIVVMIVFDALFIAGQYFIVKRQNKNSFNKLWIIKNISLNLSIILLVFLSNKFLAVIISIGLLGLNLFLQIYQHYKIYQINNSHAINTQIYRSAYRTAANQTIQTQQNEKNNKLSKLSNGTIQYIHQPNQTINYTQYTIAPIKSAHPPLSSKKATLRQNQSIGNTQRSPMNRTIQYEPRRRRQRRKQSGVQSLVNHKLSINSSNENMLQMKKRRLRYDSADNNEIQRISDY